MTSYQNDTPQAERRAVLKSDRDARDTMYARAQVDTDAELGGRWARPPTTVVCGASYPAASASHADPTGLEPPLGWDVNSQEPVGEFAEVERSIREVERSSSAVLSSAAELGAASPSAPSERPVARGDLDPQSAGLSAFTGSAKPRDGGAAPGADGVATSPSVPVLLERRGLEQFRQLDFQQETERRA
jgi:hypothetical protein